MLRHEIRAAACAVNYGCCLHAFSMDDPGCRGYSFDVTGVLLGMDLALNFTHNELFRVEIDIGIIVKKKNGATIRFSVSRLWADFYCF